MPSEASFQEIESNPVLTYKERKNVEPHVSVFSNNIDLVIVCYKDQIDALNFKIQAYIMYGRYNISVNKI